MPLPGGRLYYAAETQRKYKVLSGEGVLFGCTILEVKV
jgi:hypothetical protein